MTFQKMKKNCEKKIKNKKIVKKKKINCEQNLKIKKKCKQKLKFLWIFFCEISSLHVKEFICF